MLTLFFNQSNGRSFSTPKPTSLLVSNQMSTSGAVTFQDQINHIAELKAQGNNSFNGAGQWLGQALGTVGPNGEETPNSYPLDKAVNYLYKNYRRFVQSPIFNAVMDNDLTALQRLLEADSSSLQNNRFEENSLWMYAARLQRFEALTLMLSHVKDPENLTKKYVELALAPKPNPKMIAHLFSQINNKLSSLHYKYFQEKHKKDFVLHTDALKALINKPDIDLVEIFLHKAFKWDWHKAVSDDIHELFKQKLISQLKKTETHDLIEAKKEVFSILVSEGWIKHFNEFLRFQDENTASKIADIILYADPWISQDDFLMDLLASNPKMLFNIREEILNKLTFPGHCVAEKITPVKLASIRNLFSKLIKHDHKNGVILLHILSVLNDDEVECFAKDLKRIFRSEHKGYRLPLLSEYRKTGNKNKGLVSGGVYEKNGKSYFLKQLPIIDAGFKEIIAANVFRAILGESIPQVHLILDPKKVSFYSASEFVEGFIEWNDMEQDIRANRVQKPIIINNAFLMDVLIALVGDRDPNSMNLGLKPVNGEFNVIKVDNDRAFTLPISEKNHYLVKKPLFWYFLKPLHCISSEAFSQALDKVVSYPWEAFIRDNEAQMAQVHHNLVHDLISDASHLAYEDLFYLERSAKMAIDDVFSKLKQNLQALKTIQATAPKADNTACPEHKNLSIDCNLEGQDKIKCTHYDESAQKKRIERI